MKNNKHYSNDWLIDSFDSDPGYGTDTKYDSGAFWSGTIARIIPVSSHKWCFLDKGSTTLKYYNFNSGSKGNFAVIPESFTNASLTYDGKGGIFVSTAKKIYRISSDGSDSLLFTYTKSDGSILENIVCFIALEPQETSKTEAAAMISAPVRFLEIFRIWHICLSNSEYRNSRGAQTVGRYKRVLDGTI